jgi:uncharacterized membrane protein
LTDPARKKASQFDRGPANEAHGINRAGDIVGTYVVSNPVGVNSHGFLLAGGRFSYPSGYGPGFRWSQGSVTVIDFTRVVPGASVTVPCGINDTGQIVGCYCALEAKYQVPGGAATPYHEHGFVTSPYR